MEVVEMDGEHFARRDELSQSFALRFIQNLQMQHGRGDFSAQNSRSDTPHILDLSSPHGSPPTIRETETPKLPTTPRCGWSGFQSAAAESENVDTNRTPRCGWISSKTSSVHGGSRHRNSDTFLELEHLETGLSEYGDDMRSFPRTARGWQKEMKRHRKSDTFLQLEHLESRLVQGDPPAAPEPQPTNPALRAWHKDGKKLNDAVKAGDITTVSSLLQKEPTLCMYKGEGISASCRLTAFTPLHWACAKDHPEIAKVIIAASADVNAANRDGVTPLHSAALHGSCDCVKVLLSLGADAERTDGSGRTAESCAKRKGLEAVVSMFELDSKVKALAACSKEWTVFNMKALLKIVNCSYSALDRTALEGKVRLFVKPSDKVWNEILHNRRYQTMDQVVASGMHEVLHKMQSRAFLQWRHVVSSSLARVIFSRKLEISRSRTILLSAFKAWKSLEKEFREILSTSDRGLRASHELSIMKHKVRQRRLAQTTSLDGWVETVQETNRLSAHAHSSMVTNPQIHTLQPSSSYSAYEKSIDSRKTRQVQSIRPLHQTAEDPRERQDRGDLGRRAAAVDGTWTMHLASDHHCRQHLRWALGVWKQGSKMKTLKAQIVQAGEEKKRKATLNQTQACFEAWRLISSRQERQGQLKLNMVRLLLNRRERKAMQMCLEAWDELVQMRGNRSAHIESEARERESVGWILRGCFWAWMAGVYAEGVVKKAATAVCNGVESRLERMSAMEKELEASRASREHTEGELFHTQEALATAIALERQHKEALNRHEASYKGLVERLIASEEESIRAQFRLVHRSAQAQAERAEASRVRHLSCHGLTQLLHNTHEAQRTITDWQRGEREGKGEGEGEDREEALERARALAQWECTQAPGLGFEDQV